jgi:hypothetical protein
MRNSIETKIFYFITTIGPHGLFLNNMFIEHLCLMFIISLYMYYDNFLARFICLVRLILRMMKMKTHIL